MEKTLFFEDMVAGATAFEFIADPITRTALVRYAGASGDFNPLHHDETFVSLFGMPRVIAQGMLVMGITSRAITDFIGQKNLRSFGVRFSGMTEPVDLNKFEETKARATLKIVARVAQKDTDSRIVTFDIETKDLNDSVKLTGTFSAVLPLKS
ncbi:MAG: hypothetical protein K9K75_00210 [Deltaproteobacteria bacterium]|nr:hypothetical protein [Deltaproteobacteria bacterium]